GVDLGGQNVVAPADEDRIPEVGHAQDEDDQRRRSETGPGQRQRDARERPQRAGAQILGGFLERGIDVPQHVRQQDVGLGQEREDLRHDDPGEAVNRPRQAEPVREDTVAPEQQDEGERDEEGRRDERQETHERDEALTRDRGAGDRVGQHQRQADRDHGRDGGHDEAVHEDAKEPPRPEEFGVVGEGQAGWRRQARPEHAHDRPHHEDREEERHDRSRGGNGHIDATAGARRDTRSGDRRRGAHPSSARQPAVKPPSTVSSAPVMYDESSLARNSATLAISRGVAMRPSGMPVSNSLRRASVRYGAWRGVSTIPGWMMLHRTRSRANWMARDFVSEIRPPLAAVYAS